MIDFEKTKRIKTALTSKDDKIIAFLYQDLENGSYGVYSGFRSYPCHDVSYKVACEEFEIAIDRANYYLGLNGKYYILKESEDNKND